jgi:hypothetical protein
VQQDNELSVAVGSKVHGTVQCVMSDMSSGSGNLHSKFHIGNSSRNFNQELLHGETNPFINHAMTQAHVDKAYQEDAGKLVPEKPIVTPIKRSKRREGSLDEDSSSRAPRG